MQPLRGVACLPDKELAKREKQTKPAQEGPGSGIQLWWFLRFLVSLPAPLPFPPSLLVGANCHGKQRLLS